MQQRMRTVWVTILTLVAFMLSSAVSSAPLMPLQMLTESHGTMSMHMAESHCVTANDIVVDNAQECCSEDSVMSDHQCCYTSCVTSYSIISSPAYELSQTPDLVLISKESRSRVSSIASALFRPPIV
ncbi:hypothetical protein ACXJY6_00120 [Vibrio sp. RC27]